MLNVSFAYSTLKVNQLKCSRWSENIRGKYWNGKSVGTTCLSIILWIYLRKIGWTYASCVITVVYFCDVSYMNSWMLFIFSIVMMYHTRLMYVTPCQHQVNWAVCAVLNSILLEIPTDLKSCGKCFNQSLLMNESMHTTHKVFSTFVQFWQLFLSIK